MSALQARSTSAPTESPDEAVGSFLQIGGALTNRAHFVRRPRDDALEAALAAASAFVVGITGVSGALRQGQGHGDEADEEKNLYEIKPDILLSPS